MVYALVVIYNKKCSDSKTLKLLKNYRKRLNIIVFDNSIENFNNGEYCKKYNIEYYTLNKNLGLSKAYNYVVERLNKNDNDYIIILDDDTDLNINYFKEVFEKIKIKKYDVMLPIVKSNNQIISPSNVQFQCRVKRINEISKIDYRNITAINSGMIVRLSLYNQIQYSEDMFLDYVDHDFMKKVRTLNLNIHILNSEIDQNFSRNQKGSLKGELFRFNIYKKDFRIYCKKSNRMLYYYINIFKFRIMQCIKYKTFVFLANKEMN